MTQHPGQALAARLPSTNSTALSLRDAPLVSPAGGPTQPLAAIDAALLAWLAIAGPTRRDRLSALLWPDSPADTARNALRQRLFRLRRQCGLDLVTGSSTLQLADGVSHDLDADSAVLGNMPAPAAGELADWLAGLREQRREGQRQQLLQRIDAIERDADPAAAVPLAQALIALDPLREDAHRRLMRLHYLAGDRAAALRAFDDCEQRLKHELGARPSPETLALLATVEAAERDTLPVRAARRTLPAALMRPPRMVGRERELARLQQALATGGRLLMQGEAGLGKSRLIQALTVPLGAVAPTSWCGPLVAAGRPGDALVPYATLGRTLRALQVLWPQALSSVPAQQLAPLLPELVTTAAQVPAVRRETLQATLATVLREALTALPGIVLDDLHFADEATLQLLPELIASSGPGAWLLALRQPPPGSPAAALLAALAAASPWESLTLAPLDGDALAEMLDSLGLPGVRGAGLASLAGLLHARSGGNPLFALETLKLAWTEGHDLEAGALPRPRNVGQLIDSALAQLSPRALLLARVAAITGVDFSVAVAEHVLRQPALELADAWAELESRQVLRGSAFVHDLMHEAVLAGIPDVLARHAHGQVAEWLQAQGGEPARLAAHWEAAGQRERALPSLRAAAERAHAALRETDRVAFLLRGADIAQASAQPDEAFDLVRLAVEAHMNTVRDAAGLPLLDRLDGLARSPHQVACAAGHRAWYRSMLGDWAGAIEAGRLALQHCAAMGQATGHMSAPGAPSDAQAFTALQASISQRLGTALAMAGEFDEALPHLRSAEALITEHTDPQDAAELIGNLATVLDNLGQVSQAQPYHQRVIAATRASGDHSFLATALANLAVNRLNAGDVAGADAQLLPAQQLVSSYALRGASAGFIAALQAQAARARGDYAQSMQWCDVAEPLLADSNPVWLPVVHMHRAQAWLDLAQLARAQQALARCEVAALPARQRARHGLLKGRLQLLLQQDALPEFDTALAAAPEHGWPELRLSLRLERAQCLAEAAACAELQQVLRSATSLGLLGVALAARLRLARRAPASAAGLAGARQAMAMAADIEPNGLYRAERWLGPILALKAAGGHDAQASALTDAAWTWVEGCAARLEPPWRDTFLHRQPVNQALRGQRGAHS